MTTDTHTNQLPPPPPRTNERTGEVTTIWSDGSVIKSLNGRVVVRPAVPAISNKDHE